MAKVNILDKEVMLFSMDTESYISITDIAKYKNPDAPADILKNWLRRRFWMLSVMTNGMMLSTMKPGKF